MQLDLSNVNPANNVNMLSIIFCTLTASFVICLNKNKVVVYNRYKMRSEEVKDHNDFLILIILIISKT